MRFAYLVFFEAGADQAIRISEADRQAVRDTVRRLPGLAKARLYTPAEARDPHTDDGSGPCFGFQLYFDRIEDLEAAIGPGGPLLALADPAALPSLAGTTATQQAMLNRPFPVDDPAAPSPAACSYVVHYPGPAEDEKAWIAHYLEHHPALMRRLPGIREIEILTRLDWTDRMPWRRVHHMQRNRVMFDSPAALTAALQSPVRHAMREDFAKFPPYRGGNFHHPMLTELIRP